MRRVRLIRMQREMLPSPGGELLPMKTWLPFKEPKPEFYEAKAPVRLDRSMPAPTPLPESNLQPLPLPHTGTEEPWVEPEAPAHPAKGRPWHTQILKEMMKPQCCCKFAPCVTLPRSLGKASVDAAAYTKKNWPIGADMKEAVESPFLTSQIGRNEESTQRAMCCKHVKGICAQGEAYPHPLTKLPEFYKQFATC